MKQRFTSLFFCCLVVAFLTSCKNSKASDTMHTKAVLNITIDYEKQPGPGSNQWAVWIEDPEGYLVKTIFVTGFTADGGYVPRPACTPIWVSKANPSSLSGTSIDAFSGATPASGLLTYTWDLTDDDDTPVGNGNYLLIVEGTLFGESEVIFKAPFSVGEKEMKISATPEYTSDEEKNKEMIKSVNAEYVLVK
ncbi:MAG: DUF2271 domain-containing protein [Bacteroidales bacterium]|nr:DUF2271 domain-containing protein [Bacteroidales bacterium]